MTKHQIVITLKKKQTMYWFSLIKYLQNSPNQLLGYVTNDQTKGRIVWKAKYIGNIYWITSIKYLQSTDKELLQHRRPYQK